MTFPPILAVVTLLLTNEDRKDVKQFWQPVYAASGIEQYAYNPPVKSIHRDQWPSLRTIIASGKRLIVFMDYGEDTNEVPYILSEFDNVRTCTTLHHSLSRRGE